VTTRNVIDRLVAGTIYLHRFMVPEGLNLKEVASKWEEQGFGPAKDFIAAAQDSADLVKDLQGDTVHASLEGYLFPETYFFATRTTPRRAIEAMVDRFRTVTEEIGRRVP